MGDTFMVGDLALQATTFTIEERCGQHDLLSISGTQSTALTKYAGQPAKLTAWQGSATRAIHGYLDTHAISTGFNKDMVVTGYVLGASSVMRSGAERQWKDKRPFDIARDIVRPYGFCLEMDTYQYTIPLFVQSAESDWQLLARLAQEIGMALIGTNVVIRMVDPSLEIRRRRMRPLYKFNVNKLFNYSISASPVPLGYEARVFAGVDKFGESFSVTANPDAAVTLPAPETVRSLEDAISAAERIGRRRHRLRRATCSLKFTPGLRSGTTVALTNGADTNVWFVHEATHVKSFEESYTSLVLNRDEDDQTATSPVWQSVQWPQPTLQSARWIAPSRWEREL
jgi:hypothetical protein